MLEVIQLECARGFRTLFTGLDFALHGGELLHVAGANGSGKTSLLRILCGLLAPVGGEVRWKRADIRSLGEEYRSQLLYIGHANGVKEELTPAENLAIACTLAGITAEEPALETALHALGLAGYERSPVKTLSQGQRRRVALARLAFGETRPLWILDEPFNALDNRAVATVESLIAAHLARGAMVVLATHQAPPALAGRAQRIDLPARAG